MVSFITIFLLMRFSTAMNSSGLSTPPCLTLTLTSNSSDAPYPIITLAVVFSYMPSTILTSTYGTPANRSVAISLSTVSKAFSKSTNPRAMLSCTSSLFSAISIVTYIPSAVRLLFLNICYSSPKSHSTLPRILASKTLSNSFSTWLSSVMPLYFHGSCPHPFLFHTKISTIRPIFHSFGIIPSCIPTFSSLPVPLTPTFPAISIISSRTSFAPVALRFSYCVLKFPLLHVLSPPFSLLS